MTRLRPGLRGRLAATIFALVLLVAVGAGVSRWSQARVHASAVEVAHAEQAIEQALRLSAAVRDQYAHQAHTIILENTTHLHMYGDAREAVARALDAMLATSDAREAGTLARIRSLVAELDRNFEEHILPRLGSDRASIVAAHDRALQLVDRIVAETDALTAGAAERAARAEEAAEVARSRSDMLSLTIVLAALALAIGAGVFLDRWIAWPVGKLELAARRIARGDLTTRIEEERDDELGSLARSFNEMASDLRRHQERAIQAEKLAGIGRLAAGVAHEINNPLAVIRGYASLLARGRGDPQPDSALILQEVARCQEIVEGLLDFTRAPRLRLESVDVRELLEELGETLPSAGLSLDLRVEPGAPGEVLADRGKLRQILGNLLSNAAQIAPGTPVHVALTQAGERVTVAVHDEGPGVAPEARSRLFEPFFTTRPDGTGLGLAVSRSLAQAQGGELRLAEAERGARFELTLPRAPALQEAS